MTEQHLNKMYACRDLLPPPGGEVVAELIAELRARKIKADAVALALQDAISTFVTDKTVLVSTERQEAWCAALNQYHALPANDAANPL